MEHFSVEFFAALLKIILINIVLSGDNAIVIALASRNLPGRQRKLAIFWGTFAAVALRILLTFIVLELLKIPLLQLAGGLLLLWIAYKLLTDEEEANEEKVRAGKNLFAAIQTIVVADLVMSLDNVVAIAAAAEGNILLIVVGISISVPIMIFGSQIIMYLMERFPIIIQIGVAILAWTAGEMILKDEYVHKLAEKNIHILEWAVPLALAVAVLLLGNMMKRARAAKQG